VVPAALGLPVEAILLKMVGGVSANSAANGLSNGGIAPDIVIGANSANYTVGSREDFGGSADASGGLGYVTVTPLPAGTLFTETQSELDVSWVTYSVIVTINGTDFPVNFTAGDTQAAVIEKVPVGASLSASATIGVSAGGASLGYSSLVAATALPISIQPGENSITMWVQYPLECTMSSDAAGYGAAITGTAPAYYTNAGPTALSGVSAAATYEDTSTTPATTMYFAGWSLTDGGTPVISSSIPTGSYKGKLTLYATYSSCAVSINPGESWGANTPIIAEGDHLALTPVPAGFPSTPTYTWSIESPAADAPVTVSSSGVVSPVEGASGNATIKVTATCGAMTATATQSVTVAALSLDCNSTEVLTLDSADKTITASIAGYTGTDIEYTWSIPATTAVALMPGASGPSRMFHPFAGGKDTVSVSARITGVNKTLPVKTVDIYVLDLALSGGTALNAPTVPGGNYSLTMATTDTAGKGVTASLNGLSGVSGVTYTWTAGNDKLELTGSGTSRTAKPKAAGDSSFTVSASLAGVSVSATVDVTIAGIEFVRCPKFIEMGGATDQREYEAQVVPAGGSPTNWTWTSGTTTAANFVGASTDSGDGSTIILSGISGGKTKITVTADVGGTTLSAEQDVYILDLGLTCSDTAAFAPPADVILDPTYRLMLVSGDTNNTTVTANLAGFTDGFTYSWTLPTSSTKTTATVASSAPRILSVKPKAGGTTGTESFTVKATCTADDTIYIEKTVAVTVAGLTLTGGDSPHVFNSASDAPATANDITLTLGADGVNIGDVTVVGYESSNTAVAANPTAGADGCTVTALKGGTTTITVTATANGKTLTATKTITVINLLVKDGDGNVVPATGNTLALGPVTLAAELDGIETGVTYEWTASPAGSVTFSAADAATTTAGVASTGSDVDITVKATYDGNDYTKTMSFTTIYEYAYTTNAAFGTFLSGISGTSATASAALKITGLLGSDVRVAIDTLKSHSSVYVDLSQTTVPLPSTAGQSLRYTNCTNLVVPPQIPSGATTMVNYFFGCTNLKDISGLSIPNTVASMNSCFKNCTSLANDAVTGLTIPSSVTDMESCFNNCTSLTDLSGLAIPAGVTTLKYCFEDCSSLTDVPDLSACTNLTDMGSCFSSCTSLTDLSGMTIPDSVTSMWQCFHGCTGMTKAPVIPENVTNMYHCFYGCTSLSGTITINASIADASNWTDAFKNVDASKITAIYVPDPETKAALMEKNTQFSDSQVIVMN